MIATRGYFLHSAMILWLRLALQLAAARPAVRSNTAGLCTQTRLCVARRFTKQWVEYTRSLHFSGIFLSQLLTSTARCTLLRQQNTPRAGARSRVACCCQSLAAKGDHSHCKVRAACKQLKWMLSLATAAMAEHRNLRLMPEPSRGGTHLT